jgi:thymidine kinase
MGPMFAGKTTKLLQKINEAKSMQLRVAVITSALDNRYAKNMCVAHTGMSHEALPARELLPLTREANGCGWDMDLFDVIAIDESQFFPDLKIFCLHAVEERGKTVIVAGLAGDFERKIFGDMVSLVPFADSVDFLHARCAFCEMPASFTLRIVSNDQQKLIGGKDEYQPVCRHHYRRLSHVHSDFVP